MSDVISRQVAISAICNACGKIDCDKMDKCEKLQLPPANNSEIPNSSDTISRAKAIEALRAMQTYKLFAGDDMLLIDQAGAQTELMMLPPAQPEPKRGRWVFKNDLVTVPTGYYECSECKEGRLLCEDNFCPKCGADMRGEQDE